jgi:hypothetical protein
MLDSIKPESFALMNAAIMKSPYFIIARPYWLYTGEIGGLKVSSGFLAAGSAS